MTISPIEAGEYFRGLLLLIGKDHTITEPEKLLASPWVLSENSVTTPFMKFFKTNTFLTRLLNSRMVNWL
jgi:hypothetical protein